MIRVPGLSLATSNLVFWEVLDLMVLGMLNVDFDGFMKVLDLTISGVLSVEECDTVILNYEIKWEISGKG